MSGRRGTSSHVLHPAHSVLSHRMPTPPLPVLNSLLGALGIPVQVPSVRSVPPTLLLMILEKLLQSRLPISFRLRAPRSYDSELALTKVVLGCLADDVLALDLSLVNPARVLAGAEIEMAVVIMALAVAARRRGVDVRLPSPCSDDEYEYEGEDAYAAYDQHIGDGLNRRANGPRLLDDLDDCAESLVEPLVPDIVNAYTTPPRAWLPSRSSPGSMPQVTKDDPRLPATPPPMYPDSPARTPATPESEMHANVSLLSFTTRTSSNLSADESVASLDPLGVPERRAPGRTVLQAMVDEFGLEPT